ncbi:MAG: ribosome recycling factor [Candidatus Eutrophobiaceae bacterium]
MTDAIITDSKKRMQKCVDSLVNELSRMRVGRASPAMLDRVKVRSYGSDMPLSQVASINVKDARTLMVSVWDKSLVQEVDKAIRNADLGLNPVVAGESMRIPLPSLNEESRKEMNKTVRAEGERVRVSVRNVRRDAKQLLKDLIKSKEISEDDEHRAEERLQKITDEFVAKIEALISGKEREMLEI